MSDRKELQSTRPNLDHKPEYLDGSGVRLSMAAENMGSALEIGLQISTALKTPITIDIEGGGDNMDGWEGLIAHPSGQTPDAKQPPGPITLIGGRAIDPKTGESHFTIEAIRFDTSSATEFEVSPSDLADVYVKAAAGNQHALEAINAINGRNPVAFSRELKTLKYRGKYEEPVQKAIELPLPR